MSPLSITQAASARIPTEIGTFQLTAFTTNQDNKEHLALIYGEPNGNDILVRIHSECFTGDVLGSRRCDCGEQLKIAMQAIAFNGSGMVLYLPQEGRGIGLVEKLKAYNLQDAGRDTVEANLDLGHGADERDYSIAALMLESLGVESVRLLTNNPTKIEGLQSLGINVTERVPVVVALNEDNTGYLATKVEKMRHMLKLELPEKQAVGIVANNRPFITLTFAQSLDGAIALENGKCTRISGSESMTMTHALRAKNDGILVGIETVLCDNPRLTVRHVKGDNPRPIVLDSQLRLPTNCKLMANNPIVATTEDAPVANAQALEAAGATILRLPADAQNRPDLTTLLTALYQEFGLKTIMVEGGATVISSFIEAKLVDKLIITIAPIMLGGVYATNSLSLNGQLPTLKDKQVQQLGDDIVVSGLVDWEKI